MQHPICSKNDVAPISRHFSHEGHDVIDVKVIFIQTTQLDTNLRLQMEETWIKKLKTRSPIGLNLIQLLNWNSQQKWQLPMKLWQK